MPWNLGSRQQVAHQRWITIERCAGAAEIGRCRSVGFVLEQLAKAGRSTGADEDEKSTSGFAHGESRYGFIVVEID
jgi:hypothetical protein